MSSAEQADDLTRKQRREQARNERKALEDSARLQAARRRRLLQLGGALALAIVVIAVAVVLGTSGGSTKKLSSTATGNAVPYASTVSQELAGIPEQGNTLGSPKAPVTLVWFGDMQCPVCASFHQQVFPSLVAKYVKTNKVKIDFRLVSFIGPDSTTAANMAGAAAMQNKMWPFVSLFYYNQQGENTGYVTPTFLKQIASGAGLNATLALQDRFSPTATAQVPNGTTLANNTVVRVTGQLSTPSFLVGKTGGKQGYLPWNSSQPPSAFFQPIDQLLKH